MAGGYAGARLQPLIRESVLRLVLGSVAAAVGVLYLAQAVLG
jgi:uncharacterized membrane protein YfcA